MKPKLLTFLVPARLRGGGFRASRLRAGLLADRRGAAIPEFAMAIMPVLIIFFGMVQWSVIAYVHLIVKHAAFTSARCAAVVNPAMPDSGPAHDCTSLIAEALFKHVHGVTAADVKFTEGDAAPRSQTMDNITVSLDYKCTIPLGNTIACGSEHHMLLTEKASFPNQGSAYQQVWGIR